MTTPTSPGEPPAGGERAGGERAGGEQPAGPEPGGGSTPASTPVPPPVTPPQPPPPPQWHPPQPVPPPPPVWSPPPPADPLTGQVYSDKSKVVAGLLQLLPGFFFCLGGIGRLYAGHVGLGVAQLVSSVLAWIMLICLFWLIIPIFLFIGMWLWAVIDGVVMLAGRMVDGHGRLLRP